MVTLLVVVLTAQTLVIPGPVLAMGEAIRNIKAVDFTSEPATISKATEIKVLDKYSFSLDVDVKIYVDMDLAELGAFAPMQDGSFKATVFVPDAVEPGYDTSIL